jgi:hypothetical protein
VYTPLYTRRSTWVPTLQHIQITGLPLRRGTRNGDNTHEQAVQRGKYLALSLRAPTVFFFFFFFFFQMKLLDSSGCIVATLHHFTSLLILIFHSNHGSITRLGFFFLHSRVRPAAAVMENQALTALLNN